MGYLVYLTPILCGYLTWVSNKIVHPIFGVNHNLSSFYHFFYQEKGLSWDNHIGIPWSTQHILQTICLCGLATILALGEHVVFNEEILNYLVSLSRITHKNVQHFCFSITTFIIFSFSMPEKKVDLIVYTNRTPLILASIM